MVCQHGGKHQQIRQSLWAKLSGRAWESQRFAALPRSSWSLLQWTAAACCSQEFAPIDNYPLCLSQSQALSHECSKGLECQRQKHFTTLQPSYLEACASWGSLNFFLSSHETSPSQPVLFLMNCNAWSYSLMRQIIQSCPSFQYFTFHCTVFFLHTS